jgi:hypothetical protein
VPSSALRAPFWFDLGVCFCFMFLWGVIRLLFATSLRHRCVLHRLSGALGSGGGGGVRREMRVGREVRGVPD